MITKIFCIVAPLLLIGCASFKVSRDLGTPASKSRARISSPTLVTLSKFKYNPSNRRFEEIPSSEDELDREIQAVREYDLFINPLIEPAPKEMLTSSRVDIQILKERDSGNCYMGGCFIIPMTTRETIDVILSAYDRNNNKIFYHKETIVGERWGNVGALVYGLRPFKELNEKGPALLIQQCLKEFENSSAFKTFVSNNP